MATKSLFRLNSPDGGEAFKVVDVDGTASVHVNGNAVLGSQGSAITDASEAHALNATFSDTEVEAALNALGVKINAVIAALEAHGLIAS